MAATQQTGIGAGNTFVIFPATNVQDGFRLYGLVGGNSASGFRVNIEISNDQLAWYPVKSITSSASNDSTYVQSAEIDSVPPSTFRVTVTNLSASAQNFVSDIRLFLVKVF